MVIPFCPTLVWVRDYLRDGAGSQPVRGKSIAHCEIRGRRLTVPVQGGAATLKRGEVNPVLSDHGKWRREHIGAWQAAYGRTPFYPHLMPQIEQVYARSEGMRLQEFNMALLQVAIGWLDSSVFTLSGELPEEVRKETMQEVDFDLSIFDAIFRLGKRVSFAL